MGVQTYKKPTHTDYEVYMKYKRMMNNGMREYEAIDIIAQLSAVDRKVIKDIIKRESEDEKLLGKQEYIDKNRGNVSGNRW